MYYLAVNLVMAIIAFSFASFRMRNRKDESSNSANGSQEDIDEEEDDDDMMIEIQSGSEI